MSINVTKMQGCGNDFVILEYEEFQKMNLEMDQVARFLCDRNFGVGADGLIIPRKNVENADIGWFFYNSDGSTAQMCGNGIRCFAKYVYDKGYVNKTEFTVSTLAGIITPKILNNGTVRVNMSKPILESEKIPFVPVNNLNYTIFAIDRDFVGNAVSMGNPHFVIFLNQDEDTMEFAKKYGPIIETAFEFPEKTNVEFAKLKSYMKIELCVWERGCGITQACGTGACATTVAAILNGKTDSSVEVELPGGSVFIDWYGTKVNPDCDVFMTGPAEYVFTAELPDLSF